MLDRLADVAHTPTWIWGLLAILALITYAVNIDQGFLPSLIPGGAAAGEAQEILHEVFHDARHYLGFRCH